MAAKRQTPIPGADSLHSIRETCAMLRIGLTKAWDLIRQRELEAVRLGRRCTRIRKSSIDRLIKNGVQK